MSNREPSRRRAVTYTYTRILPRAGAAAVALCAALSAGAAEPLPTDALPSVDSSYASKLRQIERDRFLIEQLNALATAKAQLCTSPYADPDLCRAPRAATAAAAAPSAGGGPIVTRIVGIGPALRATLRFPGGAELTIKPGSRLPDGRAVEAVTAEGVRLSGGAFFAFTTQAD